MCAPNGAAAARQTFQIKAMFQTCLAESCASGAPQQPVHCTGYCHLTCQPIHLNVLRSLSRSLSVPFSSLCTAYEPCVANLCVVVCGHQLHSAGGTTASAAGRSASSQPVSAGQVNRRQVTRGIYIPGRVTDKFQISLPIFIQRVHEKTPPPKYNGVVFEILGRHH